MVASARIEGGTQILSAPVRRTIQSIKEIVGSHSDAEIYVVLQETNMDPNETAQKLLNQDPFHEVRRKRDKKKENNGYKVLSGSKMSIEHVGKGMESNPPDHSVPRGGYSRNDVAVGNREFRVVRDNRVNKIVSREVKPSSLHCSTSTNEHRSLQVLQKGSTGFTQKSTGGNYPPRQASAGKVVSHTVAQVLGPRPNESELLPAMLTSSSDPVHVPSSDSRSVVNVGAIKREFGAVGVRCQTSGNSLMPSSAQSNLVSTSHLGKDGSSSIESFKSLTMSSTSNQPSQTSRAESVLPSVLVNRSSSSNQYNSRLHQQVAGHQKAVKEWKKKSGSKSNNNSHGVTGSLAKPVSRPADSSHDLENSAGHLRDKLSRVGIDKDQNVFIAEHIRVSESDRSRLTFGSFGTEFDSSKMTASEPLIVRGGENSSTGVSISLSSTIPESPTNETSANKHVDLLAVQVQTSGSDTPASGGLSESQLPVPDKNGTLSPQNSDADIGLVHGNSPSFNRTESQQQQDPTELASFSVYNPPTGYDIPYFRPSMDEAARGQGLSSPQEALASHVAGNIPMSTTPMAQPPPQQQLVPQMYQQLHVSPFASLLPYRPFLSPVYVPPMPMPGYSGNATYPSNGNSFLLMPGGSSHLSANNLKYGIQQFKPVPAGSPTGFGNFASSTGYAINAPGVVGGPTGLEESSRIKYKDSNLYVPNPQAETSEMWIQNPRELPGLQSASYFNMAGQTPHGAYLPPHSGHASFNAAAAQSSHMQFPGLYHPPQPVGLGNPHHLGAAMGGGGVNVGVAAAAGPGAHAGAYQQQPRMSHLNWPGNF